MNIDGSSFDRRARLFYKELKRNGYPNTTTIQQYDECSRSTAQRTIDRLINEHHFPIAFDASSRGYYLTNRDFKFEFLPPGKDEYCALFLLRQLSDVVGSTDVKRAVDSLWNSAVGNSGVLQHDLQAIERHFSADLTAVSVLADTGVLELVQLASVGAPTELTYKSPWRHAEEKTYRGLIERVHLSDGSVYVMFRCDSGRRIVLNASFILSMKQLLEPLEMNEPATGDDDLGWLDGFGVWAGSELRNVSMRISQPAAEYYAKQRWHVDQVDIWEDGVLVRTFPSMISPELVRRILSLGRFVSSVEPAELAQSVREEAELMSANLNPPS